ncbi:MAG: SH3 domain-containing protein, partial [Litorilinea sp.]
MAKIARLLAFPTTDDARFRFELQFPAPEPGYLPHAGAGELKLGDGKVIALGELVGPTADTWAAAHKLDLGEYLYEKSPVPAQATLVWADTTLKAEVVAADNRTGDNGALPVVNWLSTWTLEHVPLDVVVEIEVGPVARGTQIRIDGGAGNLRVITADTHRVERIETPVPSHKANWTFMYSKPGSYTLTVDWLDADGYWLARLADTPVEVVPPIDEPETMKRAQLSNPAPVADGDPGDPVAQTASAVPWLPFRYVRPQWAWARTYTHAGGSVVSRSLALGTYLAVRQEVTVGGALWYQTGGYDWIPASSVSLLTPSDLRGIELEATTPDPDPDPDPDPEPEPGPNNRGLVTANVLNVRAGPGVIHPIVDRLRYNMEVRITDQTSVGGAVWYRIGTDRWVHSAWIRLIGGGGSEPGPTRQGVVTADVLNVRARPGVRADNPPVARLLRGAQVTIYEEATSDGAIWYRIGADRWVHGGWIQLASSANSL